MVLLVRLMAILSLIGIFSSVTALAQQPLPQTAVCIVPQPPPSAPVACAAILVALVPVLSHGALRVQGR